MRQDTSTPGSNRVRNVIAGITLGLSAFSFGAKASEVRAEEVIAAQTKAQSSLEISFKQRNWLKSASKDLARLGLIDEARYLLDLLKESDISGRYERDNKRLEIQLRTEFGKSLGLSKLQREQRTESARKELKKFSSELFEQASSADFYTQEKALRILRRIDSESEETLKLEQAVNSKRRDPQNSQYDIASVTESFQQIAELNLGFRIESGVEKEPQAYFDTKKEVSFASYKDKSGEVLKIQSTVLSITDLELLVHESVRAVTLLNGMLTQNWEAPTVAELLVLMLDKEEASNIPNQNTEAPGLLLSTSTSQSKTPTKFFTIDESNRHSPMLQANMFITYLIGGRLQSNEANNIPTFLKIGLLDFVSREITRVNAGAVSEIKKTRGYLNSVRSRDLFFSGPTQYINHEELKAVNSPELSLSNFLAGTASANEGSGRLAAVRVVQFLYEHQYLKEFIARVSALTGTDKINYQEILTVIAGKSIEEVESDFKIWVNAIDGRKQEKPDSTAVDIGVAQALEALNQGKTQGGAKPVLEDVSIHAREALSLIKEARAKFFGQDFPLAVSTLLCEAGRLHVDYCERENYYGHSQDPNSKHYTLLGQNGGSSDSIGARAESLSRKAQGDLGTVYHASLYTNDSIELVGGYSNYKNSTIVILHYFSSTHRHLDGKVMFWPPNDEMGVSVWFGETNLSAWIGKQVVLEDPNPAPGYNGYPIRVLFRDNVPGDSDLKLYKFSKSGERIEVTETKVLTPNNDPHGKLTKEVVLIPKDHLEYNTTYEIEVTGTGIDTHTSKFTTESKPK